MNKFKKLAQNKSHTPLQFMKYSLAGAVASGMFVSCFAILNETVLPADVSQPSSTRGWNFLFSNALAFTVATVVAYWANRAWVFQSGRHARLKEFTLFYLIASIAFAVGTPLGSVIVANYSISEYAVFVLVAVLSGMVNFLGRKYWVFLH